MQLEDSHPHNYIFLFQISKAAQQRTYFVYKTLT